MLKRYSESQILAILKEYQTSVINFLELCRKHGISRSALYKWKNQSHDMSLSDISKLKILAEENRKLKELYQIQPLHILLIIVIYRLFLT